MPDSVKNAMLAVLAVVVLVAAVAAIKQGSPTADPPIEHVTVTPPASPKVAAFVGDSYVAGSPKAADPHGFAWLTAAHFGLTPQILAEPGGGYDTKGIHGQTMLSEAASINPDATVIVFSGGLNDVNSTTTADHVQTAALRVFSAARHIAPLATVIVIGPLWPGSHEPGKLRNVRQSVRVAAQSAGVQYVSAERFMADVPLMADHVHPSAQGHALLSERVDAALAPILARLRIRATGTAPAPQPT